jgi:outer membrane immunogenic protein
MKKYLLAGAFVIASSPLALAADLGPAPVPVYDWTGFYLGLNAGAAWNNSSVDENFDPSGPLGGLADQLEEDIEGDQTAFTGGAQAGYNWQIDSFVLGLEADFNYLDFHESKDISIIGAAPADASLDFKADWFGTVRGRLGFAADNFLVYATGGLAYGHSEVEAKADFGADTWHADEDKTNWGWTIGGGAEYAFDENWIIGAEYLYVDLGDSDFDFDSTVVGDNSDGNVDVQFSVLRARLSYKF